MHVTVLITVYDRERYIGDAIDSVIAQDYDDWDILVVDDGSTDRTVEVVKSRMSDDRVALIQMKHGGTVAATALGIEHARGSVITSLDSDDKLMPGALSAVLPAFANNPRLGFVWTNWVDSTGDNGAGDFLPDEKTLTEAIISGWWKATHERFFRKEFYLQSGGLDTSIKYAVDVQVALLIGKTGCDTLHIPKVTYWYRIHPHQITKERPVEVSAAWRLLRRKFCNGSVALTELYRVGLEKEIDEIEKDRDRLRSELTGIRSCVGYKFMRFYGSVIDQTLPDGTRRGGLKRRVLDLLRGSS
jgi:glycosyltransferase involved in cell wall biosynthesis